MPKKPKKTKPESKGGYDDMKILDAAIAENHAANRAANNNANDASAQPPLNINEDKSKFRERASEMQFRKAVNNPILPAYFNPSVFGPLNETNEGRLEQDCIKAAKILFTKGGKIDTKSLSGEDKNTLKKELFRL